MKARYCPCRCVNPDCESSGIGFLLSVQDIGGAAMNVRYRMGLNQEGREQLGKMPSGGKHAVRELEPDQILVSAAAGESDDAIAAAVGVGTSMRHKLSGAASPPGPDLLQCHRQSPPPRNSRSILPKYNHANVQHSYSIGHSG